MCDNSSRTNNSQYDDPSYSSQNVGYSGRPQHAPIDSQNSSNQYDVRNSLEPTGDRNNGPPSQTTQSSQQFSSSGGPSDNRSNGSDMAGGSKRLHVSNIPFRFRENDLHGVFAVSCCSILQYI